MLIRPFRITKNPPDRIEMLERPWDRDLRSWTFNQGRFHSTIAIWFIVLTIKYGRIGFHATSIMWYMPYFAFLMETRNWRAWIFIPWGSVPYNKWLKSNWMWLFKPIIDTICVYYRQILSIQYVIYNIFLQLLKGYWPYAIADTVYNWPIRRSSNSSAWSIKWQMSESEIVSRAKLVLCNG